MTHRIGVRLAALTVPLLSAIAAPLLAQAPAMLEPGSAFEIEASERWLASRQSRVFTPFAEGRLWVYVDTTWASSEGAVLELSYGRPGRDDGATLWLDAEGRVSAVEGRVRELRPALRPDRSERERRLVLYRSRWARHSVQLPESPAWDLVPIRGRSDPDRRRRVVDPVDFRAEWEDHRQAWSGARTTTLVRDTLVGGRTLWIVRDSTGVTYETRRYQRERTLDGLAVIDQTLEGDHRGRYLLDPETGYYDVRVDTTRLSGEQRITLPDGRAFTTPIEWQRTRVITLRTPGETERRREELTAQRDRDRGGMLIIPGTPIEERIASGDSATLDSLGAILFDQALPPSDRRAAYRLLRLWTRSGDVVHGDAELALGDTTAYLRSLHDRVMGWRDPLTADLLGIALPYMRDPGLAHAFGIQEEPFYENIRQALLARPPALTATTDWTCTPAACELLARQWREATEPRLKELGLIARFVTDPVVWADTVLGTDSHFLAEVRDLARGIRARGPERVPIPIPDVGAGWRSWLDWLGRLGTEPARRPLEAVVRFDGEARTAIRLRELLTGRDVRAEVRTAYQEAETDSAVLVLGTMLEGLGDGLTDPERIGRDLRQGSPARRAIARRALSNRIMRDAPPAPEAVAAEVVDRLLAVLVEGAEPWPELHPDTAVSRNLGRVTGRPGPPPRLFLQDDERLPAGARSAWADRLTLATPEELSTVDPREASRVFSVRPVTAVGPFVAVGIDYRNTYTRGPDERPQGHAAGWTLYLLRTPDGYRVVHESVWMT